MMGEKNLPEGWVETEIGLVGTVVTGNTPSKNNLEYYNGKFPWVKPGDINKALYVVNTEETLSIKGAKNARLLPKGAVLVTCIGNLGNVAIAGKELATNQQINSIVFKEGVNEKFGYYSALMLKSWLIENSTSTTISMVNKSNFEKAPFLLPPLAEQNRIVAKLDALFAHLETIKTRLDTIPQLLKNFRQAVLSQAVSGKLTETWREGKELGEWEFKNISDLSTKVGSGSTPSGGNSAYKSEGIPLLRSMNIHFNGIKYEGLAFIDEKQASQLKNVEVLESDVLLNITGASIGRVCLAPSNLSGARVNQHVCIIRLKDNIQPEFVWMYLSSPIMQDYIFHENYGVTRQSITKAQILEFEIPVPSFQEQQEIVSRVESLFAKADAIEAQYQSLKAKIDTLPQALLAKAFSGQLVPQNPADEPAAELLKRIKETQGLAKKVSKLSREIVA